MKKNNVKIFPAALRGRYDGSGKVVQRLEIRIDNITNTITTVDKDNVIIIKQRKGLKNER